MYLTKFTPKGCDNSDYCEDSDDYPDINSVKEIVKKFGNPDLTQILFSQVGVPDHLQTRNRAPVPIPYEETFGDVSSRLNPKIVSTITTDGDTAQVPSQSPPSQPRQPWAEYDWISETPLCHTVESYVFPKTAKTRSRQWRFVINLPSYDEKENFVQAVKVEKCLNEGVPCNLITCDGSTTVCRQKYEFTRLLALSEDGKQYVDEFRFPSGCVCYSKKSSYFEFALGRSDESEAVLKEETVVEEDFETSEDIVSDVKKKRRNNNKKRQRNRRWTDTI
eukprot:GFUD01004431.1.p1 GENE.GFUD01004431.1~~GFUD01004431.1.p1  ORF type:complete len:277 (+),score=63.73 GFUD01004431.1:342-1172(+)